MRNVKLGQQPKNVKGYARRAVWMPLFLKGQKLKENNHAFRCN
jgi:hypothetical protein